MRVTERQPFGGPLLVSFSDGEREQAIGGQLARAMRVELDEESALEEQGARSARAEPGRSRAPSKSRAPAGGEARV